MFDSASFGRRVGRFFETSVVETDLGISSSQRSRRREPLYVLTIATAAIGVQHLPVGPASLLPGRRRRKPRAIARPLPPFARSSLAIVGFDPLAARLKPMDTGLAYRAGRLTSIADRDADAASVGPGHHRPVDQFKGLRSGRRRVPVALPCSGLPSPGVVLEEHARAAIRGKPRRGQSRTRPCRCRCTSRAGSVADVAVAAAARARAASRCAWVGKARNGAAGFAARLASGEAGG